MHIIPIAGFGRRGNACKYRLIDIDNMQIMDVPVWKIKTALENNLLTIEGMQVVKNEVKGINGSLSNIPIIDEYGHTDEYPEYTVLFKITNTKGYIVINCMGRISAVTPNELIGISLTNGLTNAKIKKEPGNLKVAGKFKEFTVDEATVIQLENKEKQIESLNARIALVGSPYRIFGNTIYFIKHDFETLNIVKPVEVLYNSIFEELKGVTEITYHLL